MTDPNRTNLLLNVRVAAVINPGDRVLLTLARPYPKTQQASVRAELEARFPDVEFTFVSGVTDVVVQHGK